MELKRGYKHSEAGIIPENWIIKPLIDITQKVIDNRGKTPPLSRNSDIELIETASISFVTREPDYSKVIKYVTPQVYNTWFRAHPIKEDILVSTVGEYSGATALYCLNRGTIAQNLIAIRIKNELPSYVFYWTRSWGFKQQLDQVIMNQAQPSLRVPWLLNFKIPLPPTKTEQTAIAKALSDADAWIQSLTHLIAKKSQVKQGAMQNLLTGKVRLQEFKGAKNYIQTEVGIIPEDWMIKTLHSMLKENPRYGINAAAVKLERDLPTYIRITDISEEGYYSPDTKVGVDSIFSENYRLKNGDLVFARTGASVGKSYLYNPNDGELVFAGFLIKISPNDQLLAPHYFSQFVKTKTYWNWVKVMSMRSGQPGINGNEYGLLQIPLPPTINEQKAIAFLLDSMDNEIIALKAKLAKAKKIKQGMMQNLLTGRIRLI